MKKKIAEWYIRNKNKIQITIILIIIIVIINRVLVYITNNNDNRNEESSTINNEISNENRILNNIVIGSSTETSLGEETDGNQTVRLEIINQFISFCNNQDIQEAYDLLSSDCKEELYPSVDEFKTNYYDQIFASNKKQVTIENWTNNIFRVSINDDSLSTGNYSPNNSFQDYISVVIENRYDYKLNINGYIGKQEINKSQENNNITITVLNSDNYMEFTNYTYRITNNSNNEILLSDTNNINAMYIEDQNGVQYSAYTHEISEAELILLPGETKEITIKYYSQYSSNKEIQSITFSNIMLNYDSDESKRYGNIQIVL